MPNEVTWQRGMEIVFSELGWDIQVQSTDEHASIICPLPDDEYFNGVLCVISHVEKRLAIYLSYRLRIESEYRQATFEAIAWINSSLMGGCIEFEPESGDFRYRDGLLLIHQDCDLELVRVLLANGLRDAMSYFPALKSISSGESLTTALTGILPN